MSLPAKFFEAWKWDYQFKAWFYTIRVEGSDWKYERLIEDNPSTLPAQIMQFYHDDAVAAFARETGAK